MPAVNLLARGYVFQLSVDGATNWLTLGGLNDLNDTITPNKVDSSNYGTNGWSSWEITMQTWSVVAKFNRQATAGVADPASAAISACRGQFGDAARLYVRWYSSVLTSEPGWQGRAMVEENKAKTGVADLNEFTATFTGDGVLTPISNPYAAASVPSILSANPSGVAAGGMVRITGSGFTGVVASGVKFNAISATSIDVLGDTVLEAILPAGSAGSAPIIITNGVGASAAFAYTRT